MGLATSRIVPFSFYPFFMLIFEDMPLNGLEFLSLISGASLEDVEGRIREKGEFGRLKAVQSLGERLSHKPSFFFQGGRQHFLEILYLKLTFLGELVQLTLADRTRLAHPELRPTLDRTWVKFGDQVSLMPQFWNFKVKVIDIVRNLPGAGPPSKDPSLEAIHFLGLAWFYTLLANKKQDTSSIYESLNRALEQNKSVAPVVSEGLGEETFRAENLFWDPEDKTVDESWGPFWEESLLLGDGLLRAGLGIGDLSWSQEAFWQRLEELRDRIKHQLFTDQAVTQQPLKPREDEALLTILENLIEKWEKKTHTEEAALLETVALSSRSPRNEHRIPDAETEATLEETVILSSDRVSDEKAARAKQTGEVDLKETTVISPEAREEEGSIPSDEKGEEVVPETVILSPGQKPSRPVQEPPQRVSPEQRRDPREAVSTEPETAGEGRGRRRQKKEEDFLAETVYISPRKREDQDKDKKA
jgi:hypothetical protein